MDKVISDYYGLVVENLELKNNKYYFSSHNIYYFFVPYYRAIDELEDIYYLHEELLKKNISVHKIVVNRDNKVITNVEEIDYVLLERTNNNYNVSLNDMFLFNNNLIAKEKGKLAHENWSKLWQDKIDYIEYQLNEVMDNKNIIMNSINYYIGLAENAIEYINLIAKRDNSELITLQHRRIDYPNNTNNYLNPLNLIFDYEVRDYAEYFKIKFFKSNIDYEEIENLFKLKQFSSYSLNLFFVRLLFPNYYFDIYEEIINNKRDEKDLLPIIDKAGKYEEFLIDIFNYLNKKTNLLVIDWLKR